jgi:hypothetical protein
MFKLRRSHALEPGSWNEEYFRTERPLRSLVEAGYFGRLSSKH